MQNARLDVEGEVIVRRYLLQLHVLLPLFTKCSPRCLKKNVHIDFLDYWARGGIALGTHARRDCFGYPPAPDRPRGNNQLWLLDLDAGSEPEDKQQAHRWDRICRDWVTSQTI